MNINKERGYEVFDDDLNVDFPPFFVMSKLLYPLGLQKNWVPFSYSSKSLFIAEEN